MPAQLSHQALVVAPVENTGSEVDQDIRHIGWSIIRRGFSREGLLNVCHEGPPDLAYDVLGLEDHRGLSGHLLGRV